MDSLVIDQKPAYTDSELAVLEKAAHLLDKPITVYVETGHEKLSEKYKHLTFLSWPRLSPFKR